MDGVRIHREDRKMNMVEMAARAIYRCDPIPNVQFDILNELDKTYYLGRARAAIEALREPSEEMCDSPADAGNEHRAKAIWQSMIDAALKE